jgi:outer membrane usher protein
VPSIIIKLPSAAAKGCAGLALVLFALASAQEVRAAETNERRPAWLSVQTNGREAGDALVVREGNAIYVAIDDLSRWGVMTGGLPTVEIDGRTYVSLVAIGDIAYSIVESSQTLILDADPARLRTRTFGLRSPSLGPVARSGWGGFVNYDLSARHVPGWSTVGGVFELGAFSPAGSGTGTFVSHWSSDGRRTLKRLETSWTIDDPDGLRSLRIGDSVTRGGVGGAPFRFAGLQFGRSFEVQPGFITVPLPSIGGEAALPSVVDVYVNNVLTGHRDVQPGPFEITNVPVVTGSGDVQLVVRDMLGRQTLVQQSYYTSSDMLRTGLDDYSVELGFVRHDFGRRNFDYGEPFAAGSYRYGLSNNLTAGAHVEASGDVQQAGIGADAVVPGFGLIHAETGVSRSDAGTGTTVSLGFERRTPRISYGAIGELMSDDYVSIGSVDAVLRPRASIRAFAGMPFGFGSVGLSYTMRDYRELSGLHILGANANIRLGQFGSLNLSASEIWGQDESNTAFRVTLSVPFGPRTHASAGLTLDHGRLAATSYLQRSLPLGEGIGYRIGADVGGYDRLNGEVAVQTGFGTYRAEATWADGTVGERLSASGSLGLVNDNLFASRRVTESFAEVDIGDFAGVGVYAENQLVGRTGADGTLIVPNLRDFDDNAIAIETADLPLDAQVRTERISIRPGRRTGVTVDFGVHPVVDALIEVRLEDGTPLPSSSSLTLAGGGTALSAPGGAVYLTGLGTTNSVTAQLTDGTCGFAFTLPPDAGPQPHLGPFICRKIP